MSGGYVAPSLGSADAEGFMAQLAQAPGSSLASNAYGGSAASGNGSSSYAATATNGSYASAGFGSAARPAEAMSGVGMPQAGPRGPRTRICAAHVGFKALALLVYLIPGLFTGSEYVPTFVAVVMLSALDLWTVKNVTGRLLVGLRWWNEVDEASGRSHWRFESFEEQRFVHATDSTVFWTALFVAPAMWLLLALGCVLTLKLHWLVLVVVCLGMTGINVYGYVKCKKDARKKIAALSGSVAQEYGGQILARGMRLWQGGAQQGERQKVPG
mmetsp:Transcript_32765/g.107001  ORF Transcript_32765/g.107001 Transcript_32765/m.107001 type:complete len:271 (-) Transcript_32765:828-1640(-)